MAKKILVVDDEAGIRNLLVRAGRIWGYEVSQADNGNSGLEAALKENPDLIITDIDMLEMNGLDLTKRLKSDDATKGIKVVVSTGRIDQYRERIIEAGADGSLPKPYDLTKLRETIKSYLGE